MTEPTGAVDTADTDVADFRAQVLSTWARKANEQNWNGEFSDAMRELGYSNEELTAARDAGKTVHKLTITVRTAGTFRINGGGFGTTMENEVARQVRQGFNLSRNDSVEVEHTTDVPA